VATILRISQLTTFRAVLHPDRCFRYWAVVITMPVG